MFAVKLTKEHMIIAINTTSNKANVIWVYLLIFLQQVIGNCRFAFKSEDSKTGNFTSPRFPNKYPGDADCTYHFFGNRNEGIRLNFIIFDLEEQFIKGCLKDYIDVTTTNTVLVREFIGRFCGSEVPSQILTMQPAAEIHFVSNHVIEHRGFVGSYEFFDEMEIGSPSSITAGSKGCGGLVTGKGGIIQSPGYPIMFPSNIDCKWLIRVDFNKHVHIRILKVQLKGTIATCDKAMVGIYDGYSSQSMTREHHPMRHYCGDIKYYKSIDDKTAVSYRNRLIVRFNTSFGTDNAQNTYVGFQLSWTAVEFRDHGNCDSFTCKNSRYCAGYSSACTETHDFCIDKSMVCNSIPNCSDDDTSDEQNCTDMLLIYGIAGGIGGLLFVLTIVCFYKHIKRKRRILSQDQNNASLQLRELDHSPSFASRQLPNSYSCPSEEYKEKISKGYTRACCKQQINISEQFNNTASHNSYKHLSHCTMSTRDDSGRIVNV